MTKLELPRTLRIPNLNEIPQTKDLADAITRSQSAKIVEGFVLKANNSRDLPFRFYAEININNSRLWDLFKKLTLQLPKEISLIFNHVDQEALFGKHENKHIVINKLSNFIAELTQDCFLEFGVIYQTDNFLEEVFVDCTKYIKFWGMDETLFRTTMKEFQISEIPDLNFIDEFPKVREALRLHVNNILETEELINQLKTEFTS